MGDLSEEKISHCSHISPRHNGWRLVDFLKTRFTYFDEDQWSALIAQNDVLLNNQRTVPQHLLCEGDKVSYYSHRRPEPMAPKNIPILYEDHDLIVVNKPPHLTVHPSGRYLQNTLINILKQQRKLDFLVLSHRLDRETSGVCVLSKTQLAKDKMYWQFFDHKVQKVYWALVWGRPEPHSGVVDVPLGSAKKFGSKIRIKQAPFGDDPKSARTKYHTLSTQLIQAPHWTPPPWSTLDSIRKQDQAKTTQWPVSLVECRPITGRTNQIRVHMAHLGCGLLGDKLYDPEESIFMRFKDAPPMLEKSAASNIRLNNRENKKFVSLSSDLMSRLVLDAHALHAKELSFRHPRSGQTLKVSAPPPKTWQGLYKPA